MWAGPGVTDPINRLNTPKEKNPKEEKKAEPADLEAGFVGVGAELIDEAELLGPDSLLGSGDQGELRPWHCTLMGWGIGATGGWGLARTPVPLRTWVLEGFLRN